MTASSMGYALEIRTVPDGHPLAGRVMILPVDGTGSTVPLAFARNRRWVERRHAPIAFLTARQIEELEGLMVYGDPASENRLRLREQAQWIDDGGASVRVGIEVP